MVDRVTYCKTHQPDTEADQGWVRDRTLRTQVAPQPALGPRVAGLLLVCMALFAMATLVGLVANAAA
jgi:hypothetical protein